jgi:hypothetical protein
MLLCIVILPAGTSIIYAGSMGDFATDVEISATALHEWMPSVTYNPIDSEFLLLWHTTGVREPGGANMYSLHGERISPDGELVGEAFMPLPTIDTGRRILPRAAHNIFTNQYMVVFCMQQPDTGWDPFITIIDSTGAILSGPFCLSAQPTNANHAFIVFNTAKRQYLIAYNDSRNGKQDVFGVIVDENGTVVKEDFPICTAQGEQQNPFICYNPTNDTYLMNWEDFRNVATWTEPGDMYGALLDGEGNIIKADIPIVDDHGENDAGGQWLNSIAYNPDRKEFLVSWMDTRPSLNSSVGIVGRFFKPDGSPVGPDFTLVDTVGSQYWHQSLYIPEKKRYVVVWQDTRNDAPDATPLNTKNTDIYARSFNSKGEPVDTEIPLITEPRNQQYAVVAYCPLMDRLLFAWRDELEEEIPGGGGSGHVTESGGNIMGKIIGAQAFLTCRILEKGTGIPVDDVKVLITGPSLPKIRNTNIGGWFNIAKGNQRKGTYSIFAYKAGYRIGIQSVVYTGEPLHSIVELTKR